MNHTATVAKTAPIITDSVRLDADARGREGEVTRLMLVEDAEVVRRGLRQMLELYPDFQIIAEAGDGEEAVALAAEHRPDVVITDVHMPRLNGIEATRRIRQMNPDVQVIGLSMYNDPATASSMREAGAAEHFSKSSSFDRLFEAIRALVR